MTTQGTPDPRGEALVRTYAPNRQDLIQILFHAYNQNVPVASKMADMILEVRMEGEQHIREFMRRNLNLTTPLIDAACRLLFPVAEKGDDTCTPSVKMKTAV
jgi:hypothetical protein